MPDLVVIGAPTSAGTHHAGQEDAPGALRAAGLLDALRAGGLSVADRGDLPAEVFAVDHEHPSQRNLAATVRMARAVADAVAAEDGAIPVVLGGDCTISLGVIAGMQRRRPGVGVFYFDGDADLATPESTSSGVLDAMGVAHLLGLAGTELARLGSPLDERRLILVGVDESDPETFRRAVLDDRPALTRFADHQVRADPAGCAAAALDALAAADGIVLHFDVDAVDSGDLPLANFPHYGTGVPLAAAGEVLRVAAAAPGLAAIVLTEVNPHYDPGGRQLARYTGTVAGAISAGRRSAAPRTR